MNPNKKSISRIVAGIVAAPILLGTFSTVASADPVQDKEKLSILNESGPTRSDDWAQLAMQNYNSQRIQFGKEVKRDIGIRTELKQKMGKAQKLEKASTELIKKAEKEQKKNQRNFLRLYKDYQISQKSVKDAKETQKVLNKFGRTAKGSPVVSMAWTPMEKELQDSVNAILQDGVKKTQNYKVAKANLVKSDKKLASYKKMHPAFTAKSKLFIDQTSQFSKALEKKKANAPESMTISQNETLELTSPVLDSQENIAAYLNTLSDKQVNLIPANQMANPESWPTNYLPVKDGNGEWQAGVAQVKMEDGKSLLVLPKETVNAISFGLGQVGIPYLWGGTTPNGFDCSGLMGYMLNPQGLTIPRTAAMQQNATTHVDESNLLPGDMVFFGKNAHHVAMYVGGDKMLEAPRRGLDVRVTKLRNLTNASRPALG